MSEYVFRRKRVEAGDVVELPDNARDIDYTHDGDETIVCWFEKQTESVV